MRLDFPTSWRHGRGFASQTGVFLQELGCKRCLVVTDETLVKLGVVSPVTASLEAVGITYTLCGDVTAEPTVSLVQAVAAGLDLANCDSIVAVGGGSVIDVAKALAVISQFGGCITDYAGLNKIPAPLSRKIVAIPTTAGTGSEISDGSALIDEVRKSKFLVLSTRLCPTVAITDPELTVSMPPSVTANSGVDALTHAIESYMSRDASCATELFSLKAIELIGKGLSTAYRHGDDIEARETVQIGATMAMIAGMNAHMGLCHALIMPLCALYHIPHGYACGMTLPHVLQFNSRASRSKVAKIFTALHFMDAETTDDVLNPVYYEKLAGFFEHVGIQATLGDFGYREHDLKTIVQETFNSVQCQFNPITPAADDIVGIVHQMTSGAKAAKV